MPFGLKVAPRHFQKFVNIALKDLIDSGDVLVFMDDIFVATNSIEHHLTILKRVFEALHENKLELQISKCHFLCSEIDFLGYKVSEQGISPTDRGIEAVRDFPVPRNVKGIQSFLGLVSFFRKFIENFSIIAKPLYDLLRKNTEFKFASEQLESFNRLKGELINAPILAIYDPHAETELHCDASSHGFGAVLMQRGKDRKFHPVRYFSKRSSDAESRYHSFELEMLAIIYALRQFRIYFAE